MENNQITEEILLNIKEAVRQVSDGETEINMETEMTAESGIDSLAFMNIIIALEEYFDIELDDKLEEIRTAKRVCDVVDIVKNILR